MNIGSMIYPVFNPYIKPTCEIYIAGCNIKCPGCHNPELQSFSFGIPLNINAVIHSLRLGDRFFNIISITGGDLLSHPGKDGIFLTKQIKKEFPYKGLWLFTGKDFEEIPRWVWENYDYVKTGPYKQELKQDGFPSSKNQKLLEKGIDYK